MLIQVPESAGELYERIAYPAGELQVRLPRRTIEALYRAGSLQVLCRQAHRHLLELALLSDAVHYEVGHIESTLILPYLPYSRADRRFVDGDCHGLKTFGEILDGMHFSHVRTLDVHSFRAQKHVSRLQNVGAESFIEKSYFDIGADEGTTLVLPDAGAARYNLNGYTVIQAEKHRDANTGALSLFSCPAIKTEAALIVDDICDGGGTFIGLAKEINGWSKPLNAPPRKLYLYVTHGIFSKGLNGLRNHFEKIYTTNSLQPSNTLTTQYLKTMNVEVFDCEPELLGSAS